MLTLKDIYNVEVFKNAETGITLREFWLLNSKPHSLNDRPAIIHYDDKGRVTDQIWMKNGKVHREGAPASIRVDPDTSVIYQESWMIEGAHFRENRQPAFILRDRTTGRVTAQKLPKIDGRLGPFRYFRP